MNTTKLFALATRVSECFLESILQQKLRQQAIICAVAIIVSLAASSSNAVPVNPGAPDYRWLFDDGTGTTITETGEQAAAKNGGFSGSPTWSTETPFTYDGNYSLQTGGTDSVGNGTVNSFNVNTGMQTTLSMWVRRISGGSGGGYLFDTSSGSGRTLWYYSNATGGPSGVWWDGTSTVVTGLSNLTLNTWYHLALVRDYDELRVYENGVQKYMANIPGIFPTDENIFGSLRFGGRQNNAERFVGQIDEYGLWLSALSDDNIAWLAQNSIHPDSITPPPAPPVAPIPEPASLVTWLMFGIVGLRWRPRGRN